MKRREFITLHTADAMTDYRSVISDLPILTHV
jgi:hypothetical protein